MFGFVLKGRRGRERERFGLLRLPFSEVSTTRPQHESRDRFVNCLDRNRSLVFLGFFFHFLSPSTQPRPRTFSISFSFFLCGRRFYHCARPRRPQPRESCGSGIRRVGSSIFRPENRKNILKDPRRLSRGSKGGRRGFLIPRFALNSTSRCQDGDSALKNASRVELRGGKVGQCVDDANERFLCIKLYLNKLESRC